MAAFSGHLPFATDVSKVGVHKLLGFVASIVSALKSIAPALALRLNFACGHVADSCMEEADG